MANWKALETLPKVIPQRITPLGRPILRLKLVGTHHEIGLRRGQELAEDMNRFQEWLQHLIVQVHEFPEKRWDELSIRLEQNLARNAPWMLEEICGMAQGSGVSMRNLLVGNFYALIGDATGDLCTSVAVRRGDEGPLLGQNLDLGPEDFHYMEEWRPTRGHAILRHLRVTLCIHECGINDQGLAVASSNLPAPAQAKTLWRWDGIHYHSLPTLVLRECASVAEATEYLRSLPPTIPSGGGYQLNLLDADGAMAVVDKTGIHTIVRQCEPDLNYTSNCTLDDEFERWRLGEPYADGRARVNRIRAEWGKLQGAPPTRQWLQDLMRSDRGDGCLCRWSQVGYSRLSFIFSPTARTMDISNGPPNRTDYERCGFSP